MRTAPRWQDVAIDLEDRLEVSLEALHAERVRWRADNEWLTTDNDRLRAAIVRAKDALLDGQSTQWVHDLLATALAGKP